MKIASDSSQKDGLNTDLPVSTAARRRLFGCVTLIGAVLVGLIIAEIVLRLVGYSAPEFYVPDDGLGYTLIPGMNGWYTKEGRTFVSINSDGFRDDEHAVAKSESTLRVAVIGDSYVEGFQVPDDQLFTTFLAKSYSCCVIRFGSMSRMLCSCW